MRSSNDRPRGVQDVCCVEEEGRNGCEGRSEAAFGLATKDHCCGDEAYLLGGRRPFRSTVYGGDGETGDSRAGQESQAVGGGQRSTGAGYDIARALQRCLANG